MRRPQTAGHRMLTNSGHHRAEPQLNLSNHPQKPAKTTVSTPKHPQPQQTKPHPPGTTTPTHQLQFN